MVIKSKIKHHLKITSTLWFKEKLLKFKLTRSVALRIFSQAYKTASKKKDTFESKFLFEEKDAKLLLTSNFNTAGQTIVIPDSSFDATKGESFTILGQILVDVLKQFIDQDITFTYTKDKNIFYITSENSKCAFSCGNSDEFVPFSFDMNESPVIVSGQLISTALKHTYFCAHKEQNPINSVRITMKDTEFTAVALDNTRMSIYMEEIDDINRDAVDFLLPTPSAEILANLLEGVDEVSISANNSHARFEWEDTVFSTQQISKMNKKFPGTTDFYKNNLVAFGTFSRNELQRSLKMASLFVSKSSVKLKISEDGKEKGILISTYSKDRGASKDLIMAQTVSGNSEATLSCANLVKAIDSTSSAMLDLEFRRLNYDDDDITLVIVDNNYTHYIFPIIPDLSDEETDEETEE